MEQHWGRNPRAFPGESAQTHSEPQLGPLHQVPYMRTSATVRRDNQHEQSYNVPLPKSGNLLDSTASDGHQSTIKKSSHLSKDPSSSIDRQIGLLAVNSVTRRSGKQKDRDTEERGYRNYRRVRSDLPEPSKLRSRRTRTDKVKPRHLEHSTLSIGKHIAQLKHKCQDFNWTNPGVELQNKHKPKEAIATARRPPPDPPSYGMYGKELHPTQLTTQTQTPATSSFPYLDGRGPEEAASHSLPKRESRAFEEPEDEQVPFYMMPPYQPPFHPQRHVLSGAPQIPDGYSYMENQFFRIYPADGVAMVTTSSLHVDLPYVPCPDTRWRQADDEIKVATDPPAMPQHYFSKSKFNED